MASLQPQVDAVKADVASPSTCTPATVVTLKKLLLGETSEKASSATKTSKPSTRAKSKTTTTASSTAPTLSTKERTVLATHVINVTIKALTEASKSPPPETPSRRHTPSGKGSLRRSLSAPLSPLQPRTLNRVATSPNEASKSAKTATPATQATRCSAMAECARVALACLRSAKGPVKPDQTDFQIETGMSTLATKLLALGLNEQALKELRLLKRRLEKGSGSEGTAAAVLESTNNAKATSGISELFEHRGIVSPNSLSMVVTCQILSLKLISSSKKPSQIEAVVPFIRDSYQYSPMKILSKLAKSGGSNATKAARQMSSLSQTLLSLAPSVSSGEDSVAMEPRLSPSPVASFELQTLAFKAQLGWWKLAGHQGKVDDDILSPFSRCVRCFIRRQPPDETSTYSLISQAFNEVIDIIRSQKHQPGQSFNSPQASIYQSLGSAAQSARQYDEAYQWYSTLKGLATEGETSVRVCSVSSKLLAVALKRTELGASVEKLVEEVVQGLNASLSGTATEVNELLESLSLARRSVAGLLMNNWDDKSSISPTLKVLLKKFLLRFPRFVLRWLGTPPGKDASTKHVLQFDQRRQVVMQSINQVLDATLAIVKFEIGSGSMEWQALDDVLQDCTMLLNNLHDPALSSAKSEQLGTYHVKMSTLYFTAFSQLRKKGDQNKAERKQAVQALTRSIDAVKERSAAEKEKAQLPIKLELLADLCKGAGRAEDATKTLRSICTSMVEEGVLCKVVTALATQPPRVAWAGDEKASTLSRTLRSIAKLDDTWNDWTFFLPEAERAAVLEHLLQINTEEASHNKPLRLHDPGMAALLRIYTTDRYPIRRLRVLLRLYAQQLGRREGLAEMNNLVDQAARHLQKRNLAEDGSLAQYIPHLRAYCSSLMALGNMDASFPITAIQESISTWMTMIDSCASEGDVLVNIDEPEALLDHLLATNKLAGLKGEDRLQLSILDLSVKLANVYTGPSSDDLVSYHCKLVTQYISIGMYTEASKTLGEVQDLIRQNEGISPATMADFYLSQAQYMAGIEDTKEAMTCLSKANDINGLSSTRPKVETTLVLSQASLVQSNILLRAGDVQGALRSARNSVKWLSQDWNRFEGPSMQADTRSEPSLAETVLGSRAPKPLPDTAFGPRLWTLARPLFDSLMHISALYAHIGMFQETIYYCETARRIADGSQSSVFKAEAATWAASIHVKAGLPDKALEYLADIASHMPREASAVKVRLAHKLGEIYRDLEDDQKADEYFLMAEKTTRLMARGQLVEEPESIEKPSSRPTKAKGTAVTRRVATKTTTTAATRARSRAAASKSKPAPTTDLASIPKDFCQGSLLAAVLLSRAMGAMQQQDWQSVTSSLELIQELPRLSDSLRLEQLITACKHISLSVEQMGNDPVFSVMHESTISFPAILGSSGTGACRSSTSDSSPRKCRSTAASRRSPKGQDWPAFAGALKQAQEVLLKAHASALANGDNAVLYRISTLLQSTVISLTAASSPKFQSGIQIESTTVAVELARNAVWKREQLAIQSSKAGDIPPPTSTSTGELSERMANLALTSDMARFQEEFVELVPKNWNVISMSLSENQHDLCITKFQSGHNPFILRLPLERANSRDADSEIFNFEHGRAEVLDIIKNANRTSHSGAKLTTKASRNAWWAERGSLDERLKELLLVMETTWLGGFRGIFSQHERRPDLLARFQKSFHQTLERNLPSRSGGGGGRGKKATKAPAITLDPRILDLFIGLGDPTDPDTDFDEALNDLLYFVVDILQFHGERNAYDEIDFDAMLLETYDALMGYYSAARSDGKPEAGAHTVLVLDKSLHCFPWESMPCMENLAVSRAPSLAHLRRLITEAKSPSAKMENGFDDLDDMPGGHYVSAKTGTYMLNPSSDLKNTQAYFQPSFDSLASWTGLVNKGPQEHEFEQALSSSDVLLYFGHGGGAQYIRGKTIRRLEKCRPATFLMGCSSAALTEAGEFECYGPVWNYMAAGCPAVVGTLWDVTDRDIDRFAGRAFEEWGLLPRGTFKEDTKGKGKDKQDNESDTQEPEEEGIGSLAEAVARARAACRFKYLNAAAVVMYGIPVYIEKDA